MPTIGNQESVDFEKEILPILRQSCFECHGEGNTEGELSLDSISAIRRGGHTGSPLLSSEIGSSELYLRITSLSDGYRMPKKGDPLPQRDIDRIGQWIQQVGVASPATQTGLIQTNTNEAQASRPGLEREAVSADSGFAGMQPEQLVVFGVAAVVILGLLVWMFFKMTEPSEGRRFSHNTSRFTSLLALVIGVLTSIGIIALGYFYWRTGELVKENQRLRTELRIANPGPPATISISETNLPMPPHPMHPPRLGGKYYRGNDERDNALFNRGFYRTATIDLNLVDSSGKRLEWGDASNGDVAIEIRIQRAPNATRELFSQRVLDAISIRHYSETDPTVNRTLKLNVVEHEDLWTVKIPLKAPKRGQRDQGMVYMMYGFQPAFEVGQAREPRPHFGVRYDLRVAGGKISNDSELWMGSLYTLGNRVLIPDDDKILLDRWFDWRPIPVIEGKASTDPKLLGTEEHLNQ